MKHLNLYITFLISFFLYSCSSDEQLIEENIAGNDEITNIKAIIAELETDDIQSRTSFTTGTYPTQPSPVWMVGDSIGIYPDEGDQLSFRINTSGKTCPFDGGGWAMKASSSYTAYSPFQRSYYLKEKSALPVDMTGQKQKGNDNAGHLGAYDIQIAKGDKPETGSLVFQFERKVALVRMELTAPCAATWKSVTLESNAAFTTKATMNLSLATPTVTPTAQSNSVTLELENVRTTADNLNIVAYMMLLPVDLTGKSLSVRLTDVDDNVYTANATVTNSKTNISAGAARWITAEFTQGSTTTTIPYVTFTAENPKGFKMTLAEGISTLQYSVDDGDWQDVVSDSYVTFGGEYGALRLRGNSSLGTGNSRIEFAGNNSHLVSCTGDIRTLLDYANYATVSTSTATFSQLFYECDELTTAPELPSMELAESCYIEMFWGCTNLVNAPKLPATTLAKKCYYSMFAGCTKLATAPEISAITVAEESCVQMFSNCTSLTTVPDLHATELAEWCFNVMFNGCSSLVKAPLLPAQTLAPYCYAAMFPGCTSLSEVTMLATDISAENCLANWLNGVSSTGTFTKASDMEDLPSGSSGIPSGWTVVDYEE